MFEQPIIYKRNQGRYTRSLTAVGLAMVLAAICYYAREILVNYLPTDQPEKRAIQNVDEGWVFADPWPNALEPQYRPGDAVTKEAKERLDKAGIDHWMFRAARPIPLALHLQVGVPVLIFAAGAVGIFFLVNSARFADFLIATESEMKKVSWSTKAELIGSTVVVIMTVFFLAAVIFVSDSVWIFCMRLVGALPGR